MFETEVLFLCGFVVFIVAILLVDMLVIDRTAHEVSVKEASIWTGVWILLALSFAGFLWFHGDKVHGIENFQELQAVAARYGSHLTFDSDDFQAGLEKYRHYMTISYLAGYLIEKMLSVDNLFVMMMIFTSFGVSKTEYQHVLDWGILGAIVLRFIFIFAGTVIVSKFDWVLLIFGLMLVYSGIKMYIDRNKEETIDVERHPLVRFLSKYFRVFPRFAGDRFFVRAHRKEGQYELAKAGERGLLCITPLLVTIIVIEFSDLIFAFDSIPAVFSVSLDPYVVFFSNIFAILGLRAMFFLLTAVADRFRYLKTGVCVLLLFIGAKLLFHNLFVIDAVWSLVVIIAVLVVSIVASLAIPQKQE